MILAILLISLSVISTVGAADNTTRDVVSVDEDNTIAIENSFHDEISYDDSNSVDNNIIGSSVQDNDVLGGLYSNDDVEIMISDEVGYGAYAVRVNTYNSTGLLSVSVDGSVKWENYITEEDIQNTDGEYWALFYPNYLDMFPSNKYLVEVKFKDNSYSSYSDILLPDENSKLNSLSSNEIIEGESVNLEIKIPNSEIPMNLYVDDELITSFVSPNYNINYSIQNLSMGEHRIEVAYDNSHVFYSEVFDVKVFYETVIISSKNIVTSYNDNKYFVVSFKDNKGNPMKNHVVLIYYNSFRMEYNTDNNGQVKQPLKGWVPYNYNKVEVYFLGDEKYKECSKFFKIIIKKATPKLTASAKTFKKSLKTKKYTVTLKTNQNKVMKNTKLTLKVNKKTYTAKTNAKGQATFKITKLTKKGTFKATITYKGSAYYNKITKNINIKCK